MLIILILFAVTNIAIGYLLGFIRGLSKINHWTEAKQRFTYLCAWRDGFFHILDDYDEDLYIKIRPQAIQDYLEFKGHTHNIKH